MKPSFYLILFENYSTDLLRGSGAPVTKGTGRLLLGNSVQDTHNLRVKCIFLDFDVKDKINKRGKNEMCRVTRVVKGMVFIKPWDLLGINRNR